MIGKCKVTYLELPDGEKLISYHRRDYKAKTVGSDYYSIDGGQDGYVRCSGPDYNPTFFEKVLDKLKIKKINYFPYLKECDLDDCFSQAREEFEWGSNFDKNGIFFEKTIYRKLKDLETDHIETLVDNYTSGFIQRLMLEELEFRKSVDLLIQKN